MVNIDIKQIIELAVDWRSALDSGEWADMPEDARRARVRFLCDALDGLCRAHQELRLVNHENERQAAAMLADLQRLTGYNSRPH